MMTIRHRFERWRRSFHGFRVGLKAGRVFGRSEKLFMAGSVREALQAARNGLNLLSVPGVDRKGSCGGLLLMLTIRVEQLGREVGEGGANATDIADAIAILREVSPDEKTKLAEVRVEWLPYLETRRAQLTRHEGT